MNDPNEPSKQVVTSFLAVMVILTGLWVCGITWAVFLR
jgi:hypothetical protein